jgi:hypothetical protein
MFFLLGYNTVLPPAFILISCSAYSVLKMEATCSSEMSVGFQWTTWRYIPDDRTLCNLNLYTLSRIKQTCIEDLLVSTLGPDTGYPVFFLISWGGVRLSPFGTWATNWPEVPVPDYR